MHPDFLKEETRDGFLVTAERKKHWACMLDMLEVFLAICRKHQLRYFATDGTLLGAVRHNGFIPWDDDVDLGMPRPDYDRFLRLAPRELPRHLALVHKGNELENPYPFARIRDGRTTCIIRHYRNLRVHHGVFIDIFPLDGMPNGKAETEALRQRMLALTEESKRLLRPFLSDPQARRSRFSSRALMPIHLLRMQRIYRQYEQLMRSHPFDSSDRIFEYWFQPGAGPIEPMIWDKRDFADSVLLDFEHLKLPSPKGYDHYLRMRYGEYTAFPAEKKGTHGVFKLDCDHPFTDELPPNGVRWALQRFWARFH